MQTWPIWFKSENAIICAGWWRAAVLGLCLALGMAPMASSAAYRLPTTLGARTSFAGDDDFLDYVQRQTFNYFWLTQDTVTGLVPDRASNPDICSIAAVGFGLSSINVAVTRGWITRAEGAARVRTTLEFLRALPQGEAVSGVAGYRGWFYHFLDLRTGLRAWNSELSTIDTALLLLGVHDCGLFFDAADNADEAAIRQAAATLLQRVDWAFMRRSDQLLAMAWDPVTGHAPSAWIGYNEAMALYLLGLGAENDPLPPASWTAWTSGYQWRTHFGHSYVWTPTGSLFTHQYSHCWVDFLGINDAFLRTSGGNIDYFENSRRATLAQQAYALTRPFANYGALEFGLTACDGPGATIGGVTYAGYAGRGAPPGAPVTLDDGTLAPTAVLGSLPFAPEICLPAARHLYDTYRTEIWSDYGFCDSFNPTANRWFDPDLVGIDAGPIVLMIENHRRGSVWRRMLRSPVIQRGLQRAGFTAPPPDGLDVTATSATRVSVTWSDRAQFETGFQVEASTDGQTFNAVATAAADAVGAGFDALAGTTYTVRVRTLSAAGPSGYRETRQVTTPAAATITVQPADTVVTTGRSAELTVVATGEGALTYQWFKGGVAIAGANTSTLPLANVQGGEAGTYHVVVSSAAGSLASRSVSVAVNPAFFPHPSGVAVTVGGVLFVADASLHTVQRVSTAARVGLLAGGSGMTGAADGIGSAARFNQPGGLAVDAAGTVFVSDTANALIRKIAADGTVTTLAGSSSLRGNTDGTGAAATFGAPSGLALDAAGNLFVADASNHTIRKVTPAGVVTTFVGAAGLSGTADGTGTQARFNTPTGVALDAAGNLYVADSLNGTVRRITPGGAVTTHAGVPGVAGATDGAATVALFNRPLAVAADSAGNIFVADTGNSTIRKIAVSGAVKTWAGLPGIGGLRDGAGATALFNQPSALVRQVDGTLWVADPGNAALRRIDASGAVSTPLLTAEPGGGTGGGTTPPPVTPSHGGGGGGAISVWAILTLAGLALGRAWAQAARRAR